MTIPNTPLIPTSISGHNATSLTLVVHHSYCCKDFFVFDRLICDGDDAAFLVRDPSGNAITFEIRPSM